MTGTVENEKTFVNQAVQLYGPGYAQHLRDKGFTSEWFLHHWAAITQVINEHSFGPRVLDLGCGPGWTSIFLAGRGLKVTGADVAADMLAVARENAARLQLGVEFCEINMRLPFTLEGGQFDAVLIFDALHHCPDERVVLESCFRNLRAGGRILLLEPDWFHQYSPSARHARRVFGTTERGLGYGRLKRSLKAVGFVQPRRFFCNFSTPTGGVFARGKALAVSALTLTVGYPHRPVIVLAQKPAGL